MMMEKTKIALSAKELELVCNTEWILTKHAIVEKVITLFGRALEDMQQQVEQYIHVLPGAVNGQNPKISKGENFKNLPYVMLDYPRYFHRENTLAIRTFFWWGNFFSINLQLSGIYKDRALPALAANFSILQQNGYWICTGNDPWNHSFDEDNFKPLQQFSFQEYASLITDASFIKISKKKSLQQWDTILQFIKQSFEEMLKLLAD